MKIAISTAVYYPMTNGVAVFSHNLALGLASRGHEVLVLCPSRTGKNHAQSENGVKVQFLKSINARVYPDQVTAVPAKKKLFYKHGFRVSVFPAREVKKALDAFQPDVVHIQVSDPIGLSVASYAKKHQIPIVTTEHNQPEVITDPIKLPAFLKKPVNAALSSYFLSRQKKSNFVTMPTQKSIKHLLRNHSLDVPIAAVSNGVDLSNFKPGRASDAIYQKYNIPKGLPTVLYVGRVDPEKQVGTVLEAFKKARSKVPKAIFAVVGDGVDKLRLEAEAKKLGISDVVYFLGRVLPPDLYELYKVGDVFATASEIETQGIVLIEAAATGLPLIAVNKGAVAEVCITDENGFLCTPGSVSEIEDALVKILSNENLRQKFSQNSLKIAKDHDLNKTIDRFINIYQKITRR